MQVHTVAEVAKVFLPMVQISTFTKGFYYQGSYLYDNNNNNNNNNKLLVWNAIFVCS